ADTTLPTFADGLKSAISAAYAPSATAVSQFTAGFGTPILQSNLDNHALFTAQTTDFASWSDGKNPDLFDGNALNVTPHLTIKGKGTGDLDYYSFTVTDPMLAAGGGHVLGTFDIDHGMGAFDKTLWGSQLRLYKDGQLISAGRGWSDPSQGG